jgi:DNA-binding IclR family transcriptional regulator
MLSTVFNAGRVLDLFTPVAREWGATAVAEELGVAKSQAHELLTSLAEVGLLRRAPGGRYRLGWRQLTLGRYALQEFPPNTSPLLKSLADRCACPVELVVPDRDRSAVAATHRGQAPIELVSVSRNRSGHAGRLGLETPPSCRTITFPEAVAIGLPVHRDIDDVVAGIGIWAPRSAPAARIDSLSRAALAVASEIESRMWQFETSAAVA